jgi:adenylate kinase family enzyme
VRRSDDNPIAIRNRLQTYHEATEPLVEYLFILFYFICLHEEREGEKRGERVGVGKCYFMVCLFSFSFLVT